MKADRTLTLQRKFIIDNMTVYFQYGKKEIEHLKKADKKLAAIIDQVGIIERVVNPDLFSALVHSIIGQRKC